MCTVDQLKEIIEQRFNELEGVLIKHADTVPASVSRQYSEISSHMMENTKAVEGLNDTLKQHNNRLSKIELWKAHIEGAGILTKSIYGLVGVFIVASTFGLFNMYIAYKQLPLTIRDAVRTELSSGNYQLEIVQ